jgi:YVTN family beta-propeller protein
MIYVANYNVDDVTVINGVTDSTTTVSVGAYPYAIAVNPVTNMIYVANEEEDNVTIINGATNVTTTVSVGAYPEAIALNPLTDMIYVANSVSNNVTVINGASSTAASLVAPEFKTSAIGYNGVLVLYSLNGRLIFKTLFSAAATKESLLHVNNKTVAQGVYKYCFLKDQKILDEGSLLVK